MRQSDEEHDGGRGRSQDSAIVSNSYCAWCHAPSQPGVTDDIGAGRPIESTYNGVSCIACHDYEAVEVSARCGELVPSISSTVHAVPPFE